MTEDYLCPSLSPGYLGNLYTGGIQSFSETDGLERD